MLLALRSSCFPHIDIDQHVFLIFILLRPPCPRSTMTTRMTNLAEAMPSVLAKPKASRPTKAPAYRALYLYRPACVPCTYTYPSGRPLPRARPPGCGSPGGRQRPGHGARHPSLEMAGPLPSCGIRSLRGSLSLRTATRLRRSTANRTRPRTAPRTRPSRSSRNPEARSDDNVPAHHRPLPSPITNNSGSRYSHFGYRTWTDRAHRRYIRIS